MALDAQPNVDLTSDGQVQLRSMTWCHTVVLDQFFDEAMRTALLTLITAPNWDHSTGPGPLGKWVKVPDGPGLPDAWGLSLDALHAIEEQSRSMPVFAELASRLGKLYPEFTIASQPPNKHFVSPSQSIRDDDVCGAFVANAAMPGQTFRWHVDADPSDFPEDCDWVRQYGQYPNTQPGKPLFVTLLLYLNPEWKREWAAETLFLDDSTEAGLFVRPKPYRAVLMEQHTLHRLSPPSVVAPHPRYSLVWKLLFWPRRPHQECCTISLTHPSPASTLPSLVHFGDPFAQWPDLQAHQAS